MKKRILTVFVSAVLVVGLMPSLVWAAETDGDGVAPVERKAVGINFGRQIVGLLFSPQGGSSAGDSIAPPERKKVGLLFSPQGGSSAGDSIAPPERKKLGASLRSAAPAKIQVSEGWSAFNGCEWQIDQSGCLTIRPLGNGEYGTLTVKDMDRQAWPWVQERFFFNPSVKSVVVMPGVDAGVSCNGMFSCLCSVETIDLSGLETSNVTSMERMFSLCFSLREVNFGSLDTSNVTTMETMFAQCNSLTELDLSSFDFRNVRDTEDMFRGDGELVTIYVAEGTPALNCSSSHDMFYGCKKLVGQNGTKHSVRNVDAGYARIDKPGQSGYFTAKAISDGLVDPVERVEPVDEVDPVNPVDPSDAVDPVDEADPVDQDDPSDSVIDDEIVDGATYLIVSSADESLVLDVAGVNPGKGANAAIWTSNGGLNQGFIIEDAGNGYYRIRSAANPDLVLDASGIAPRKGSNVSAWTENGGLNQLWVFIPQNDGTFLIANAANENLVLDASGIAPRKGSNVSVWERNGGVNQAWVLVKQSD